MLNQSLNKQIGSILLVIGTEVGAGVLALPIIIAHTGLWLGTLVLLVAWAVTLYTALLLCESLVTLENGISFATLASQFLGKLGNWLLVFIFLWTLFAISMAYISAAGSTFSRLFNLSPSTIATLFVLIFGVCVVIGTQTVDYVNRMLLSLKLGVFLLAILLLIPALKTKNFSFPGSFQASWTYFPAIITTFILHNIIPTIRTYLQNDLIALKRVVLIGSLIPLILYFLWIIAIIGNIPAHGFLELFQRGNAANVGDLLEILAGSTTNALVIAAVNFVATISVTTSFLGTSISLYHFSQDLLGGKRANFQNRYIFPSILTFIIPLLTVLLYPNIFILALNYAGAGATLLFIIIPVLITKRLAKTQHRFSAAFLNNPIFLNLTLLIGIGVLVIQCWW